jgi:DNA invertase Pin-like site-specific DNA recombinase
MTTKHYLGYIRVSTDKQADSGAGLQAQINFINAEASKRGATVEIISEGEGKSGKKLSNRRALLLAIESLNKGEAQGLIVSKLDRLSRSVADFLTILDISRRNKWALVIGDLAIDTSSPIGEAMATVSATFAQLERARISERTREGLAVKKSQGVKLGRPVKMSEELSGEILKLRLSGLSFRNIADKLNGERVQTVRGGKWHASTIKATVKRVA